jgi:hypothetical protein
MTVASHSANRYLDRPSPSGLADVIDTILDKGLVIDVFVRVSLIGIELLTIDARIVIASVDTYLRFAEAVNRVDLTQNGGKTLPELVEDMTEGGSKHKTEGAIEAVKEKVADVFSSEDEDEDENYEDEDRSTRSGRRQPQSAKKGAPGRRRESSRE